MARAKNSGGPNFRPILAIWGERKVMIMAPVIPPKKDATVDIPMAFPANPFWDRGYPSKRVAAAEGVPGVLMRMPDIDPP